jgi:hypothetical protein
MKYSAKEQRDEFIQMTKKIIGENKPEEYFSMTMLYQKKRVSCAALDDHCDVAEDQGQLEGFVKAIAEEAKKPGFFARLFQPGKAKSLHDCVFTVATGDSEKKCIRIYTSDIEEDLYAEISFTYENEYIETEEVTFENDGKYPFFTRIFFEV